MFERHKQTGRSKSTNFKSKKLLFCLSAVFCVTALTQTFAFSERKSVQAAARSLRMRSLPKPASASRKLMLRRKVEGRPIPQTITQADSNSVALTVAVGTSGYSSTANLNTVYVSVNDPAHYQSPNADGSWPYILPIDMPGDNTITNVVLKRTGTGPIVNPLMVTSYANNGYANSPDAKARFRQAAIEGNLGATVKRGSRPVDPKNAADLLSTITFSPPTVVGGCDVDCTVILTRAVTRADERAGWNIFWVDCTNHVLLQPNRAEWPYKKLRFRKGDTQATFTIHTQSLIASDGDEKYVRVYAYPKYGDPTDQTLVSSLHLVSK